MTTNEQSWLDRNRDIAFDFLRILIGVGLLAKGIWFLANMSHLVETIHASQITWGSAIVGHYVAATHIAGGVLLTLGLLTRWAALAQVPVLLGAIGFVHLGAGLFMPHSTLEFAFLMLASLGIIATFGAGRLSVDHWLTQPVHAEPATKPARA